MRKVVFFLLIISFLFLTSCEKACETDACFQYKIEQEKLRLEEEEKVRLHNLEMKKVEAEIEASKPVEVKVAEIESSEMSAGEGIATAAGVAGAAWVFGKILDSSY